ncbi:hypothetical protein, partial [Arthrobacter sp. 260]|uniref:hypothetical protein n=1 Tax=Arthrobacter sp. 260 TaxID=2735314 RepID=UPI0017CD96D3
QNTLDLRTYIEDVASTSTLTDITVDAGTAAAPSITFTGDTDTGVYSGGANKVDITTGGTKRVEVSSIGLDITGAITST